MSDRIKPIGCTCQYPDVIYRNMNGHHPTCPIYIRWAAEKKHGKDPSHCPTCGQPLDTERKRICAKCQKPIVQHHKYRFITENGKTFLVHRHCDNPYSYQPKEAE